MLLKGDDQQQATLYFVDPMKLAATSSSTCGKLTTTCVPKESITTIQHSHTVKEVVSYEENLLRSNENNIKNEIVNDLHLNKLLTIDIENINEIELKKPYLQHSNTNINHRSHSKCDLQLNMKSNDDTSASSSSIPLISKNMNIVTKEITSSTGTTRHLGKSKDDSFIHLKSSIHSPGM